MSGALAAKSPVCRQSRMVSGVFDGYDDESRCRRRSVFWPMLGTGLVGGVWVGLALLPIAHSTGRMRVFADGAGPRRRLVWAAGFVFYLSRCHRPTRPPHAIARVACERTTFHQARKTH